MLTGQEAPDAGTITIGDTVKLAYVDQSRDALDANKTVWEEISGGAEILVTGRCHDEQPRLLRGLQLQGRRPAEEGGPAVGRRTQPRAHGETAAGGNVLLLDEPTNDLDVETLQALEAALEDFAGCAVIISHDRFFLDRLCTHILAFEGDAHVEWFEGNFEAYEEDKVRRLGPDSIEPKRVKYKKFTRSVSASCDWGLGPRTLLGGAVRTRPLNNHPRRQPTTFPRSRRISAPFRPPDVPTQGAPEWPPSLPSSPESLALSWHSSRSPSAAVS
jgi:hypothetical protein